MSTEDQVAAHYGRPGLEEAIVQVLVKLGKDPEHLDRADIAAVDELHSGWAPATAALAADLAFPAGAHILDIGSGIGGPARHFAAAHGVHVTGIDLTDEFVATATGLTRRCGLADRATFRQANALALPFVDASFDGAYSIHVAMNIADKAKLFAEARRMLKAGARFGIYDLMRTADGDIPYPMPWAASAETSFVETPATYRALLSAAGFTIESEADRGDLTRELARKMREKGAKEGPPPLGPHTIAGPAAPEQRANVMKAVDARTISPIEMIARAV